jgi:hypothetical protein
MLLSTRDFHENRTSEGHNFRVGVKKFTLETRSIMAFERKELLG